MSNKSVKMLVIGAATLMLCAGVSLYFVFEKQGFSKGNGHTIVSYNVKDYIETEPIIYNGYEDIYNSINVSKIKIKNISSEKTKLFTLKEDELIGYIKGYYNQIKNVKGTDYIPVNTATSIIKTQVNGTVLSVFYELDFDLDSEYFSDDKKKYFVTFNLDLGTEKAMTNDDLLNKYNYTKDYLANKIFDEDVMIGNNEIVIDNETNISLTGRDVEKKKNSYVERIKEEFDNIINMYIENNSLVIAYNKKELNELFFDVSYDDEIIFRYLK